MAASDQGCSSLTGKVGEHQFRVGDRVVSVYSGAVHYWRLERALWADILDKVKGMGFNTITTYIPWEVHELARGTFDWGTTNPSYDIDAFLSLCEEKGLMAIVRPGPQINSELTWFGYPRRILEDPELWARSAQGSKAVLTQAPRPIPALSYAADKFFDETALWYDAICPILARHLHPRGCVVAVQVDNEMAYFFHVNAYACDYSAASIRRYREFLAQKYASISVLTALYRQSHESFETIDPPRRFEAATKQDIPFYTDWIEYRERYLVDSLSRLAGMLRARGLSDTPLFHNYPHPLGPGGSVSGITTPFNLPALEESLDFVGFDIYSRKELYDHVKTVVSYVVGSSRYPFIPEFIAGVWPWYLNPGGLEDEEFVTKAALMHGIKGFSRYMIVERNRWLASPVRRDGRVRADRYEFFRRINEVLKQHDFKSLERVSDVLLLANRDYDRLEAASVLVSFPGDFLEPLLGFSEYPNFMTVSDATLGFEEPVQVSKSAWFWGFYQGLTASGHGFLLGDTGLPLERLQRCQVLCLSSFEYMDARLQQKVVALAQAGGTVVLGPQLPRWDQRMASDQTLLSALGAGSAAPLRADDAAAGTVYAVGRGRVVHLRKLTHMSDAIDASVQGLSASRVKKSDPRLDATLHRSSSDPKKCVVFVANPSPVPLDAAVGIENPLKEVRDIWEQRSIPIDDRSFSDQVPAYTIKMYECRIQA